MTTRNPFQPATTSVQSQGKTSIFSQDNKPVLPDKWVKRIEDIPVSLLHAFPSHPFKVMDDDAMAALCSSIEHDGIHTPLLIRRLPSGDLQIVSGHRRAHAARILGLSTVPALVVTVDDDTATIMMVDANLNRPRLLVSEQAKSMRARYEARIHQGIKHGDNPGTTADKLAKQYKTSEATIRRLVTLGKLPDEILDLVDKKRISEKLARSLTSFTPTQLTTLASVMVDYPTVKLNQYMVDQMRKLTLSHRVLSRGVMIPILTAEPDTIKRAPVVRVSIPHDLLPQNMSGQAVDEYIRAALLAYAHSHHMENTEN